MNNTNQQKPVLNQAKEEYMLQCCQRLSEDQWLFPDIAINTADRYDIFSIIFKLAFNTLHQNSLVLVLSNNSERKMY